jgi:hypothetical protein
MLYLTLVLARARQYRHMDAEVNEATETP